MNKSTILYTAVKALIKNDKGQVLVLKQSDPTITGAHQYHPPGGILEFGETVVECVAREVKEEVGIVPVVGKLFDIGEWQAIRGELHMQFVGLFYICELGSYELILENEEVSEADWVDINTIDTIDILEPSKTIIKRYLQQV
jgi:mutator protein MutT